MNIKDTIRYYKEGIEKYDRENPATFRDRLAQVNDEFQELLEEKNLDELIDVIDTIGRVFHQLTGSDIISYAAWPTVKKHGMRYKEYGCIRSRRNCHKYCQHN